MHFATVNTDFDKSGNDELLGYIRQNYGPVVIGAQEVTKPKDERAKGKRGVLKTQTGTRLYGEGVKIHNRRRIALGKQGAHRTIATGGVDIDPSKRRVRVIVGHAPHKKTLGGAAHLAWMLLLAARVRMLNRRGQPTVVLADFNWGIKKVLKLLGGDGIGTGPDGIVVSKHLKVKPVAYDAYGKRAKLTGHFIVVGDVTFR